MSTVSFSPTMKGAVIACLNGGELSDRAIAAKVGCAPVYVRQVRARWRRRLLALQRCADQGVEAPP